MTDGWHARPLEELLASLGTDAGSDLSAEEAPRRLRSDGRGEPQIRAAHERGKGHGIVVVAEGARYDAAALGRHFAEHHDRLGFELRVTTLGHVHAVVLRGRSIGCLPPGSMQGPRSSSRGMHGVLVGLRDGRVAATPLSEVVAGKKALEPGLVDLAAVLAR